MADQPTAPEEQDDKEESGRKTPRDILALQRIVRMLDDLPENEMKAVVGFVTARYS